MACLSATTGILSDVIRTATGDDRMRTTILFSYGPEIGPGGRRAPADDRQVTSPPQESRQKPDFGELNLGHSCWMLVKQR